MPRIEKEVIIKFPQGLHARPAAMLVQVASQYNSDITIQREDNKVNGKSIMGLLTLGAEKGSNIIIIADGEDAQAALDEIEQLMSNEEIL